MIDFPDLPHARMGGWKQSRTGVEVAIPDGLC